MKPLLFPIRAVSKQTGISIDTIRAWERRYQVVTPQRDERGRLFTEADVRRLQLLRSAVDQGHAIGQLAPLTDEELQNLIVPASQQVRPVHPLAAGSLARRPTIDLKSMMADIGRLAYAEVEKELSLLAAVLPPRDLIREVVLPLLKEVGEAWNAGSLTIAHEHMTSALLRNLLGALVPLYSRQSPPARLLFATPAKEKHEFGILLSAMLTAGGGLGIVYLGSDLPADEIIFAAQKTAPQAVVLGLVGANGAMASVREVGAVAEKLPARIELWVGGPKNPEIVRQVRETRALLIDDFDMLEQHLIRLGARF